MGDAVRIEISIEAVDNTSRAVQGLARNMQEIGRAAGSFGSSAGRASEQVSRFDRQAGQTSRTLQGWLRQKWEVALQAKDKITPILGAIKSGLTSLAGKAWNITMKAFDFVSAPVRGIFNLLKNPVFQAGSILGVSIGLKDTVDTYKGFEAAMSQVKAISGATTGEMDRLTDKAKQMGATTKFTAEESAQAFNYMAMAGWKTGDMMNGIEGIMNLAAASGEDLATTSDIVTDALTAFGLSAGDANHFADVLAAASSNSNTNVGMMGETFKYAAAMAGTLGYSIEDTALAIGLMANAGIKSSQAGTELNSIFTRLSVNTNGARDAIEGLGIDFFDSAGSARPFIEVLDELRDATKDMNDQQKTEIANTIAGQRAQAGLLAMLNASEKDYQKLAEAVNNADGASKRMSETMLDNLQGSFVLLQSAVDGAKIALGERLAPYLRQFADGLTAKMPEIQQGIGQFMDWFDGKVQEYKELYAEVTNTEAFQNADIFGKAKILWDEMIAEPFKDWWEGSGKEKVAGVAGSIGSGIGSALKNGLLALLGIDISSGAEEGVSIGRSFAEGFAAGFDRKTVGKAFRAAISGMLEDVGKFLPGGAAPGLDSAISALLLYKLASPAIALGKGAFGIGKSLFGVPEGAQQSLAASAIGSAAQGTGLLGLGANTAINLGAGNLAGGASLGAGALAGIGLASIAGGVIGAGAGISGGIDLYRASRTNDQAEREMLQRSGGYKVGGVAAGAATGAAIGAVLGPLGIGAGALIGAGVGGVAGYFGSRRAKKEYEDHVKAQKEAADAAEAEAHAQALLSDKMEIAGTRMKWIRTHNKELRKAFGDSAVSAEEFSRALQDAAGEKVAGAFGDITLSMQEIRELASTIASGGKSDEITGFHNAAEVAGEALGRLRGEMEEIEKLNWQASIGLPFSETDVNNYKAQTELFGKDAQNYLKNRQYEGTLALRLVSGEDSGLEDSLNAAYASLMGQLEGRNAELQEAVQRALEDGVIGTEPVTLPDGSIKLSEYEEITNLQNQVSEIMNKVTDAESNARLDMLKIKYGGTDLSADSFRSLQEELAASMGETSLSYDEALKVSLTNLEIQLGEGAITDEQYEAMKQQLGDDFRSRISDMNLRSEGFQLDTIAEAFGEELAGAVASAHPDLAAATESTSDMLKEIMDAALAIEPEPAEWTQEQISQWFGLDGLDAEMQTGIGEMLRSVAETIPESVKTQLEEQVGGLDLGAAKELLSTRLGIDIAEAIEATDLSQTYSGIETLRSLVAAQVELEFSAPINVSQEVIITYKTTEIGKPTQAQLSGGSSTVDWRPSYMKGGRANGGFVNGAELSWIGEDGPEAIIPLGGKRRRRGLELYEQVGEILGVARNAAGGLYGANIARMTGFGWEEDNSVSDGLGGDGRGGFGDFSPSLNGAESGSFAGAAGSMPFAVSVSMNPQFTIEGAGEKSEDEIVGILRRHIKEMADEMGGEIAERLLRAYENMPLKGAL